MMKSPLVSLLLCGALLGLAACSDATKAAKGNQEFEIAEGRSRSDMKVEKYEIKLGTVYQRTRYDLAFPFEVNGPDPISISQIDTSCGCTSANIRPDWDPDFEGEFWPLDTDIPAGAKGTVVAVFDGSLYTEEKASTITIRGNFLSNKVTLGVEAFIEPIFKIDPPQARFGELQLANLRSEEVSLDLVVTAMQPFEIVRWKKVTPGIRVAEIGEPVTLEENRMARTFRVTATNNLPEGTLTSIFIAETSLGEDLRWDVLGTVLGPIEYWPPSAVISYGVLDHGRGAKRNLKLVSAGMELPEPTFEIVGEVAKIITPRLEVGEAGKQYTIQLPIEADAPVGRYEGLLRVSFPPDSGIPTREVALQALIR